MTSEEASVVSKYSSPIEEINPVIAKRIHGGRVEHSLDTSGSVQPMLTNLESSTPEKCHFGFFPASRSIWY